MKKLLLSLFLCLAALPAAAQTKATNGVIANPTITINTVACTLGSSCTISAAGSLVIGSSTISGGTNGDCLYDNAGVLGNQACGSGGSGLTVGTTTISSGTNGDVEFNNAGVLGEKGVTGSGVVVLATSPTVSGLTVTGSLTATGLVTNADLANSTISGVSLGSNLATLTISSPLTGTSYNGSSAVSIGCSTCLTGVAFPLTVSGTTTSGGIPYFSSTTVLTSSAALAANSIVVGGGAGVAPSTDANATLSAGALSLGASGTAGSVKLGNATTGTITVQPVTGALGSVTASLPANTGTISELNLAQTWAAVQTYGTSDLVINGGSATAGIATVTSGGVVSSATVTAEIDTLCTPAQGQILYRNASTWVCLAPGTSGQALETQGASANPIWASVTGSGTVTSITPGAGISGSPTSTNTTPITTSGTLYQDASYEFNQLGGLTTSNDGTSSTTVIDFAAGTANDSTNVAFIKIGAFTKSTQGAWASGSGSNGMGNGLTIGNNTWYYDCLAYNGGTPDIWFDTSVSCANKPTGISGSLFRRIGEFKTDGSAHILGFLQVGNTFYWNVPTEDVAAASIGTTPLTTTINVPPGVSVTALGRLGFVGTISTNGIIVYNPSITGDTVSIGGNDDIATNVANTFLGMNIARLTNTSAQLKFVSNAASQTYYWVTYGWTDPTLGSPGGGTSGGGSGVTSVGASFTGGLLSVSGSPITTSGTLALTVAGTSGGIPYFSSGTTWASSAAGVAGDVVTWGGTGTAPGDSGVLATNITTLNTTQTISGSKTFSATQTFTSTLGTPTTQSGTTYTFTTTDCGTEVNFTSNSAVTATIPATLVGGCEIAILQAGTAKVSVNGSAVTPATLHSSHSYTGTLGTQWSMIGISIESTGVAVLTGDGS